MISNKLVSLFIKNSDDINNDKVRNSYGLLAGIIGIVINIILFVIKLSVGLLSSSIAIMADAFNNLSDAASSVVTIVGFIMSSKPADAEHPFGHGRMEYISALIVAFMVMLVGVQFIKSSVERILNPEPVVFELIPFLLLLASIVFKLWLSRFNKLIGNKINSTALKATAVDALGDVVTTTVVVFSFLVSKFITFPIDGYIGVVVALAILYSGFSLVKETITPLLGAPADPALVKDIEDRVLSYQYITGVHDLVIHNYGPGKTMASIHAEIPSDINIMKIHDIIDTAEREISEELKIYLVIHMDPICIETEEIAATKVDVDIIISSYPMIKSIHDFRIVGEGDKKNLIFDVVVNYHLLKKQTTEDDLKNKIIDAIKEKHPHYNCIITIDHDYNE